MKAGRASKTAAWNGFFRAIEHHEEPGERLFADALVATLLPLRHRLLAATARLGPARRTITGVIDGRWPGVRSSLVARTRWIDELTREISAEVEQVVILGAGFDTRAWRLPCLASLPVFEIDHPDTQKHKRRALRRRGIERPALRFVSVDLGASGMAALDALVAIDAKPTFLLWEGVTNYLSPDAVDETLRWCARAAPGSHLVFTYIDEHVLVDPAAYAGAKRMLRTVARAGEGMTFGIAPARLPEFLASRGLVLESDLGAAEFRERFLGPAGAEVRGHEFYRVAHARVAGIDRGSPAC